MAILQQRLVLDVEAACVAAFKTIPKKTIRIGKVQAMMIPKERAEITAMRQDCSHGKEDYQIDENTFALFSPESAKLSNKLNFLDLTLPDSLYKTEDDPNNKLTWQAIRAAWLKILKEQDNTGFLLNLKSIMKSQVFYEDGFESDINMQIHRMISFSLLRVMICDLSDKEYKYLQQHILNQLDNLVLLKQQSALGKVQALWRNLRAAHVIKKAIKRRLQSSPDYHDLLQPVVDMYSKLGMDRALDAMMTVVTAITGPPGGVAVCMIAKLLQSPDWQRKIIAELDDLKPGELPKLPFKSMPVLHGFIKESLRMWSVPIVFREARCPFSVGKFKISEGDTVFNSMYFLHRNEQYWQSPHEFDPLRWQRDSVTANAFVPFGWNPMTCIGAQLGTNQFALLIVLFLKELEVKDIALDRLSYQNLNIPYVSGFKGKIVRKS
ncbi:cytochrome P450 [Pseudoalteromonas sp. SMS1]|uniref:cytochrome P450 n=1 Tax=Pseudoalteromonas sp. SMS1 TaxID=2908894 RepID=UPI001F2CFCDF|nr:cytochrome P450 [Pseudoalteromonas sp. SMS1]MCF2859828.1 cytochrome P450 [Pseudoalteromonas sp. SMS1]